MTTAQSKSNDGVTAIIFAVFAVACIGAFLAYRGSDVGQLSKLVGNLGGGTLFGSEGVRHSVVGLIAAGLIGIAWFGLGSVTVSFVRRDRLPSKLFEIAFTTAIVSGI